MLIYTEVFIMHHYVGFSQFKSQLNPEHAWNNMKNACCKHMEYPVIHAKENLLKLAIHERKVI